MAGHSGGPGFTGLPGPEAGPELFTRGQDLLAQGRSLAQAVPADWWPAIWAVGSVLFVGAVIHVRRVRWRARTQARQ